MKKNFITIIIPYHRKKKYFQETIKSILNQTYKYYELIVIYDDENKEELKFVEESIKKVKQKKIIINKKNIGVGSSRNLGIKFSKGEYIAFCDADDIWHPDKLNYQLNFMKKNKILFSHSSYKIINEYGKKLSEFIIRKKLTYLELLKSCDIGLSTVMISKKLLVNSKFLNTKTKEDYYLWLNLIKKINQFIGIKKSLVYWRCLDNSLSSSLSQKIIDSYKLYKIHTNKIFFIAIFYTLRLSVYAVIKKIKLYK